MNKSKEILKDFQKTRDELENWKSQIATSNKEIMGLRKTPFVFTEQGVSMQF